MMALNMFQCVRKLIEQYQTHDAQELLQTFGVYIYSFPMHGLRGLYKCFEGCPTVLVDSQLSERERQFVLAHELAHHLFHRGLNRVFLERCTFMKTDCYEREAELFAACLLCPFPEEYIFEGETVSDLAHRAGFSEDVAKLYLSEYCKFNKLGVT